VGGKHLAAETHNATTGRSLPSQGGTITYETSVSTSECQFTPDDPRKKRATVQMSRDFPGRATLERAGH